MPKIYVCSLTKRASDDSVIMFTNNEFINKFGRSFNHQTDFIDVVSGDCNNILVYVEGVQLDHIQKNVFAVFDRIWNNMIKLNYIVVLV